MKSKRRHELKENVLAHELQQAKSFLSRYGGWVAGAALVVAIGWLIYGQLRGRQERARAAERDRFDVLNRSARMEKAERLKGFLDLAGSAEDPVTAAASAVRAANIHSQDFLTALQQDNSEQAEEARRNAEKYYRMAIAAHPELKQICANARLGLGILHENNGDMEGARTEYEAAEKLAGPGASEATRRLAKLDAWFATRPLPRSRPATRPAPLTRPASGP